jgi:serine/threonine protein kinase
MELLEGETLRELIASRSLDVATAVALAIQVADAVDSAYGKAIIHPDIKPANIFVTATLVDLGLSIELTIESRLRFQTSNPRTIPT